MSKSVGNFVTVREALNNDSGDVIRFAMLKTHYRQPIDWTLNARTEAFNTLVTWERRLRAVGIERSEPKISPLILEPLLDDLNTPQVMTELHALYRVGEFDLLGQSLAGLGFVGVESQNPRAASGKQLQNLINDRAAARKAKDFAKADAIRRQVEILGFVLLDRKDPETGELVTTWEVKR
jgi:cysteinyl-tRNA synthetase